MICVTLSLRYLHKLTVTGRDPVPIQIRDNRIIQCESLRTLQEEAHTIIIDQIAKAVGEISFVYANDTDVFVLLLHFLNIGSIKSSVFLLLTSQSTKVVDIRSTISKHQFILHNLLLAHALSVCDTVGTTRNISKKKVVSVLQGGSLDLSCIGDTKCDMEAVLKAATMSMVSCHNVSDCEFLLPWAMSCSGYYNCEASCDCKNP